MAWIAKDNDGQEVLFASCPHYNGTGDRSMTIPKDFTRGSESS